MRTIEKGFKQEETMPLPVWRDDDKVLQYDSSWADDMVCKVYGDDKEKYEVNPSTLELFYLVSNKMRFKVAEITYESYFTDIKGQEWEDEWLKMYGDIDKETNPEDYEMYNITIFHFNHRSLKSKQLNQKEELNGTDSTEYIKGLMEKMEREDDDEDTYYS